MSKATHSAKNIYPNLFPLGLWSFWEVQKCKKIKFSGADSINEMLAAIRCYISLENYGEAKNVLAALAEYEPEMSNSEKSAMQVLRGQIRLAEGDVDAALQDFYTAEKEDPTSADANMAYAQAYYCKRDFNKMNDALTIMANQSGDLRYQIASVYLLFASRQLNLGWRQFLQLLIKFPLSPLAHSVLLTCVLLSLGSGQAISISLMLLLILLPIKVLGDGLLILLLVCITYPALVQWLLGRRLGKVLTIISFFCIVWFILIRIYVGFLR